MNNWWPDYLAQIWHNVEFISHLLGKAPIKQNRFTRLLQAVLKFPKSSTAFIPAYTGASSPAEGHVYMLQRDRSIVHYPATLSRLPIFACVPCHFRSIDMDNQKRSLHPALGVTGYQSWWKQSTTRKSISRAFLHDIRSLNLKELSPPFLTVGINQLNRVRC